MNTPQPEKEPGEMMAEAAKTARSERWGILAAVVAVLITILGAIFAGGVRLGHIDGKLDEHGSDIERIGADIDKGIQTMGEKLDKVTGKVDYISGQVWRQNNAPPSSMSNKPPRIVAHAATRPDPYADFDP